MDITPQLMGAALANLHDGGVGSGGGGGGGGGGVVVVVVVVQLCKLSPQEHMRKG